VVHSLPAATHCHTLTKPQTLQTPHSTNGAQPRLTHFLCGLLHSAACMHAAYAPHETLVVPYSLTLLCPGQQDQLFARLEITLVPWAAGPAVCKVGNHPCSLGSRTSCLQGWESSQECCHPEVQGQSLRDLVQPQAATQHAY